MNLKINLSKDNKILVSTLRNLKKEVIANKCVLDYNPNDIVISICIHNNERVNLRSQICHYNDDGEYCSNKFSSELNLDKNVNENIVLKIKDFSLLIPINCDIDNYSICMDNLNYFIDVTNFNH